MAKDLGGLSWNSGIFRNPCAKSQPTNDRLCVLGDRHLIGSTAFRTVVKPEPLSDVILRLNTQTGDTTIPVRFGKMDILAVNELAQSPTGEHETAGAANARLRN